MTDGAAEACISCICKRVCRDTRIRSGNAIAMDAIGLEIRDSKLHVDFWIYYFCDAMRIALLLAGRQWRPPSGLALPHQLVEARLFECKMRPSRLAPVGGPSGQILVGRISCARTSTRTTIPGREAKGRGQPASQPASQRGDPVSRVHDKFRRGLRDWRGGCGNFSLRVEMRVEMRERRRAVDKGSSSPVKRCRRSWL